MGVRHEIAERCGCSLASVDRVLNGHGPVSAALRARVRQAALELGHTLADESSSSVRTGARRNAIGVLVPSLTNPVFAQSLSRIQDRVRHAGHSVLIAQSNYDPAEEVSAVSSLLAEPVLGLLLTLCDASTSPVRAMTLPPTVLLFNRPTPVFPAAVTVDNAASAHLLVEHLVAKGHRRILFVSGHFAASDRARLRHSGYLTALAAANLKPLPAVEMSFTEDYAELDLTGPIERGRPTAIVASNDLLALGVLRAVRRLGLRVPGDISVAGFDGMAIGRMIEPTLTTVDMPNGAMGAVAASLLIDMIHHGAAPRLLELGVQLYEGDTTSRLGTRTA